MSRPLKFRAFNKVTKTMADVLMLGCQDGTVIIMTPAMQIETWRVEDADVLQFTGLTDKNGKEIYEGDILSGGDVYGPWAVVWEVDGWVLKDGCALHAALGDKEVIGNIYENSDLLV